MSLLSSLARAYEHLPDAPEFGYSDQKIGFCVILHPDGSVAEVADLRDHDKKRSPRLMSVPVSPKRSGKTPRPFFMWDNINYALGAGKLTKPDDKRHDSFRDKHLEYLEQFESNDILTFCAFLRNWSPEQVRTYFDAKNLPTEGI
ncbi:MAG: type I-C CRISPR-associated protein Cas8c/Csd1, partial [Rhodobacteraceae bacterium]|nr:type I-C CRISPR-associated protein Cas8c/Csd1 [Paracoccaceae bacterium]